MKDISVKELKTLIDTGNPVHLLDVREPEEHQEYNIGGVLLPLGKIMGFELDDIDHLKEEEVFVYCRSGKRSMQACLMLEQAGFQNITNVSGGILAWQEQNA